MTTRKKPKKTAGLTLLKKNHSSYPSTPQKAKLEAFRNTHPERDYWIEFDCPEFTSICPITGQPDFGHISISYIPGKLCLESKSLKLYLFSYRNHGAFHEEVVNLILDDIVKAVSPRQMCVRGVFNKRGGIGISVEAHHPEA